MAGQQGTGKHPHKSSEEPFEHHEKGQGEKAQGGSQSTGGKSTQASGSGSSGKASQQGSDSSDLSSREYTDEQGNVHHHTRTYQEQHGSEKKK